MRSFEEQRDAADGLRSPDQLSFLSGVSRRHLQEESPLQHDLNNWVGANAVHVAGVSTFELGDRRLQVVYANRNELERTLGVDLIYVNSRFNSFVLVQYKLMHHEGYRPSASPRIRSNG
jgi:hypothetical protein